MKNKLAFCLGVGVLMSGSAWSQGRPLNQAQELVQVGNAFTDIQPETAQPGATFALSFSFQAGVQAPPAQVNPIEAVLGGAISQSIERDGNQFTAVFELGADVPSGPVALEVSFPSPNGTVTFEQLEAVAIGASPENPSEGTEGEPGSVSDPEPVLINEAPATDESEPTTNAGTAVTNVSTTAAVLSVEAPNAMGEILVNVSGDPGSSWQLQVTSDLSQWSDFVSVDIDESGIASVDISSLAGSPHFLRGVSSATSGSSDGQATEPGTSPENVYSRFGDAVEVYEEGDVVVLRSTGVPNHPSPYFGVGHEFYEAYNGENSSFRQNPNSISEQDLVFRVPKNPSPATNPSATPLGPIGVSINGVPFFNQYAGPNNQPLTNEINSFDQYGGHPAQRGNYHYHVEPLFLSEQVGRDGFFGVLLDGYPVYGPEENGEEITNADLDEFHGHFGATKEFPEGIYHYHFTAEDPYLNGAGFYGEEGMVTQ